MSSHFNVDWQLILFMYAPFQDQLAHLYLRGVSYGPLMSKPAKQSKPE